MYDASFSSPSKVLEAKLAGQILTQHTFQVTQVFSKPLLG